MIKKLKEITKLIGKHIKKVVTVIEKNLGLLTIICMGFQIIISYNQTEILKQQTKIQNRLVQPFFKVYEFNEKEEKANKIIEVYNNGEECHINEIFEITFLMFEVQHDEDSLKKFLLPIGYYNYKQMINIGNLVCKFSGDRNAPFIGKLKKNRKEKFNYFEKKTFLKIDYKNKLGEDGIAYFTSRGEPLDNQEAEKYFELYNSLRNVYPKSSYYHKEVTIKKLSEFLTNEPLMKELENLKNRYKELEIWN